jgi:metal-responsive CopG/Arc/MetJ family transcriptional regulator
MDRITITIQRDVLAGADKIARKLERSRSWVVNRALREYLRAHAELVVEDEPCDDTSDK